MRQFIISRSAPIGASLFILTVLLRDIVISRSAPIGADFDDSISHYSCNEEAPIGADLNMTVSLITELIKRNPIGADFDMTIALIITVRTNRHQLVPLNSFLLCS